MTMSPPDDYSRDELLAFELPDLGSLRQATERVAEAFTAAAETLTPMGNPMETCRALGVAANAMVAFAAENERYYTAAYGVQADPHKASLANYEQSRAKKGRPE